VDRWSYAGTTMEGFESIEPTIDGHQSAAPALLSAAESAYEISLTGSASDEIFELLRRPDAGASRTCEPAGGNGCREAGVW
jgi:hypothetical protein